VRRLIQEAVAQKKTVVVDFVRYTHWGFDVNRPGKSGETLAARYFAFVLQGGIAEAVDLGPADRIERAIDEWREAIARGTDAGEAARVAESLGVKAVSLSITHTAALGMAHVILEG
jgi:hypothetical protein